MQIKKEGKPALIPVTVTFETKQEWDLFCATSPVKRGFQPSGRPYKPIKLQFYVKKQEMEQNG